MITDHVQDALNSYLTSDDDPLLWALVLETMFSEVDSLALLEKIPTKQFIKIGSCSHWFRPHQSRWTAMGGFAWPTGWHNVSFFSGAGLPELDWSVLYEKIDGEWQIAKKFSGKDRLEIRVSVPARSARHNQAAIHSLWMPKNRPVFCGFRGKDTGWSLVARSDFDLEQAASYTPAATPHPPA